MYNYLLNFQPVLLGAPLQLGALSTCLVCLWVNPALHTYTYTYCTLGLGLLNPPSLNGR